MQREPPLALEAPLASQSRRAVNSVLGMSGCDLDDRFPAAWISTDLKPRLEPRGFALPAYSTVTLFARLRGLSTSVPRATAVWYASSCSGTTCRIGLSAP